MLVESFDEIRAKLSGTIAPTNPIDFRDMESMSEYIMNKQVRIEKKVRIRFETKRSVALIIVLMIGVSFLIWTGIAVLLKSDWSVFLIHPVFDSNMFIFFMFAPLIISTRIRILRHEREELQQTLATFTPILVSLQMSKDDSDLTAQLDTHVSDCLRDLGRAKFYDSVLYFFNLLVSGYLALCASRAALLFSFNQIS